MKFDRYFYFYAWLVAVALYVRAAFTPDYYAIHHDLVTHPLHDAVVFSLVSAFECAVLTLAIRPWSFHRSRGRLLLGLVLFTPWAAMCTLSLMHQSPFYGAHALWLLLVATGLVVAIARVRRGAA